VARGRLITVEGLDGAGKTTLVSALAQELGSMGPETWSSLREPGGVDLSERIRALVKDPGLVIGGASRGAALRRRTGAARRGTT
jgi:dTMP kinase